MSLVKMILKNKTLLTLLFIMLLGGLLRFYGLEIQSLRSAELRSAELAGWQLVGTGTLGQMIQDLGSVDPHPPGYYAILHYVIKLFGDGEAMLRLPSAIAGFLAIPAIYLLGRRIYSSREGLIAALFTAVLWVPIYYSQEARAYSLLLLFSIVATYFWWGLMTNLRAGRGLPPLQSVGYIVSAVICAYLHYFGIVLVGLQGIALLVLAHRTVGRVILLYLPVVLAYTPWLPFLRAQFVYRSSPGFWIQLPTPESLVDYFRFLFNESGVLLLVAWALFSFLLLRLWDDFRERDVNLEGFLPEIMLVAWLLVPLALTYAASHFLTPIFVERFLIISLPAAYLLLARSLTRVFSGGRVGGLQSAIAVGLAVLFLAQLHFGMHYYTTPQKEQMRELVQYAIEVNDRQPQSLIAYCGYGSRLNYYFEELDSSRRLQAQACDTQDLSRIREEVRAGEYRYVVLLEARKETEQELIREMRSEFEPVNHKNFYKTEAYLFQVEKERG